MSLGVLMIAVLASALGMGYFVYGKKQANFMAMLAGAALCVVPFLIGNLLLLLAVCLALAAAPFLRRA